MVKIDVQYAQNQYIHQPYSTWDAISSIGTSEMGWVVPELLSTLVGSVRQVEKSFEWNSGLKNVCNTYKLENGLSNVSYGYEFVYALTNSPKELAVNGWRMIHYSTSRIDRVDALAAVLGEVSAVCGAIKFLNSSIGAINVSHLIDGVETTKYAAGLASCVLKIGSARHWITHERAHGLSESAKEAYQARLIAKRYSYGSNASLGILYTALLANKRTKVSNYVFLASGLAFCVASIACHFKNQRANYAEAKDATARGIAPAA